MLNYLADRRDTIRNNIETSEKLLTDAEESLAGWQQRAAAWRWRSNRSEKRFARAREVKQRVS